MGTKSEAILALHKAGTRLSIATIMRHSRRLLVSLTKGNQRGSLDPMFAQ
jgi:hypothetical protein